MRLAVGSTEAESDSVTSRIFFTAPCCSRARRVHLVGHHGRKLSTAGGHACCRTRREVNRADCGNTPHKPKLVIPARHLQSITHWSSADSCHRGDYVRLSCRHFPPSLWPSVSAGLRGAGYRDLSLAMRRNFLHTVTLYLHSRDRGRAARGDRFGDSRGSRRRAARYTVLSALGGR
jgi:hypothetical protein